LPAGSPPKGGADQASREHDCMPAGLAARASSRSAWARAIGRAARRTGSSFKNPATPVRRRQKRIGAVEYPKLASDTCIRDCGLYERFAHSVRVGFAAVRTWDLDLGMPSSRERPHISCYLRRDGGSSGRAQHGQTFPPAVAIIFSGHSNWLLETRSEPHRPGRPCSMQPGNRHAFVKCARSPSVPVS
jgi:hypothetical protein